MSVAIAAAGLAVVGHSRYEGSALTYLLFNLCYAALVIAAFPRPRLYVYTVLAVFLLMGLWAKTIVHTFWRLEFLEPVGGFGNSGSEWDAALLAMSAAALGVVAARCVHLWYRRRPRAAAATSTPMWFARHRRAIWLATFVALIGVNLANLEFAFYQIGVNPKLLLPLRLHIVVAWLVNIGLALWVATLIWWDHQTGRRTLAAAFLEAFLSSVSAFSRIMYLVHAAPYWLAIFERRREFALGRKTLALLAGSFLLLFVASIFAVFWLRAIHYPANADLGHNLKSELPQLALQRWTGLEAVLAVGSAPGRGIDSLRTAVTESPKIGGDSIYQRVAKSRYRTDDTRSFTFGSNVGPVAILLFSGSLSVVFAGMAALMFVLVLTEDFADRWTSNPFLLAVSGAALASVVSQTTFFYLTLIFVLQMWLAIVFLGAVARLWRARG